MGRPVLRSSLAGALGVLSAWIASGVGVDSLAFVPLLTLASAFAAASFAFAHIAARRP